MLTENDLQTAVINRLKAVLPAKFTPAILAYPEKPEQITSDLIRTKYPSGLFVVESGKSEKAGGMEMNRIVVNLCGLSQAAASKLATAVKITLSGFQVAGATRFEFESDEKAPPEDGVIMRGISFTTNLPACQVAEARLTTAIAALNL